MLRLAKSLTKRQSKFFDTGALLSLKPLISREIAEDIQMTESTVNRARKNKYVDTPHGLLPLDFFFDKEGFETESGDKIATKGVKEAISKLMTSEDKGNPYTDEELAYLLESQYKVRVNRRTITKYREAMGFFPARLRKRL